MHHPRLSFQCLPLVSLFAGIAIFVLLSAPSAAGQKTALRLDGTPADPFSLAAGKPVVLLFVRTDCPISNRYAPLIKRISSQYADKVGFWLVYPGKKTSADQIRRNAREYAYELPAVRDPDQVLVAQAQAQVTPEVAVFDGNHRLLYHGRIDDRYRGLGRARSAATTHELEDAIRAAIYQKKPPVNMPAVGCYISDLE